MIPLAGGKIENTKLKTNPGVMTVFPNGFK
jgi:hypothetical protein